MEQTELIIAHLRMVIGALGADGGHMGPSVYDTSQVLRLAPPAEGVWEALDWLIAQQQPDGGWCNPAMPYYRAVPTLAAILAVYTYDRRQTGRAIVDAGLRFLRRQSVQWAGEPPDDIPVGAELVLPYLLKEAAGMGLDIDPQPYRTLIALGERRRQLIDRIPAQPGTTHVHSWEAWGRTPELWMIDPTGGVGHSPAATAAWLHAAAGHAELAETRIKAQRYLQQAARATGTGIPGIMPTAWPIDRFEQAFALYMLLLAGLLDHPRLRDIIQPQLADMAAALRPDGIGFSDFFVSDGDDTAAALAVLHVAGYSIDPTIMYQFAKKDHFYAYTYEIQPSVTATAHAVHLLALCDTAPRAAIDYLITHQRPDGRWCSDKWNASWLYTTWQVLVALLEVDEGQAAVDRAIIPILSLQDANGGWGTPQTNAEETAYAVLALRALVNAGVQTAAIDRALSRGEQWMQQHYAPFQSDSFACWTAKQPFRVPRLSQMIELAATFPQDISQPLSSRSLGSYV